MTVPDCIDRETRVFRPVDDIYALQAAVLMALANPRRLEIVHLLADGPWEVGRLAERLEIPQPAASRHLAALRAAGLVEAVRSGREVRYQLTDGGVVEACELMRQVLFRQIGRLRDMADACTAQPEHAPVPN